MTTSTRDAVAASVLRALGLAPIRCRITSATALAAALRWAGSFRCPCSPRVLIGSVAESLAPLTDPTCDLISELETVLDELISYGDFIEAEEPGSVETRVRLLYTAAPSFVELPNRRVLILGVTPESVNWMPQEVEEKVEYRAHIRSVDPRSGVDTPTLLTATGFFELPYKTWLQGPKPVYPNQLLESYTALLKQSDGFREPADIEILDPTKPSRYYKGRWAPPASATGTFVARRPRRYGAPLWCFVKLAAGRLVSLVDLPVENRGWRGCDEAWRLQAAIDAIRGDPQIAELLDHEGEFLLRLFSPLPRWVTRQMDTVATSVDPRGSLFSYRIPTPDVDMVSQFLERSLWIRVYARQTI